MKDIIVGLKELRQNMETYASEVKKGKSFIIVKRSKPIFKLSPPDEDMDLWECVIDGTKIKKGGIPLVDLLARL
ncbi:MAG: hypothetical protein HZA36_01505 [Parcubacteria group bacterium]|nr:hypothetical protein [Parcubacteria group bacterium]